MWKVSARRFPEKWGEWLDFCSESNGNEALPNLRSTDNRVGSSSVLEEAWSSKITRISFLFQFLQRGAEKKEFLPYTTALMRHLGRGTTYSSGPIPWGAGLWSWLVMQEARRESREGEIASVHLGALQESCWWLYSYFASQLYLFRMSFARQFYSWTCVLQFLFICDEMQQTG